MIECWSMETEGGSMRGRGRRVQEKYLAKNKHIVGFCWNGELLTGFPAILPGIDQWLVSIVETLNRDAVNKLKVSNEWGN